MTWNGLLGLGSSYPADPNLGVNPTFLKQGGGEPWLLWAGHLDAAASALTLPAALQGLHWWAQQHRETIPAGYPLSSGTRPRRVLGSGSESALAGPWGSLTA